MPNRLKTLLVLTLIFSNLSAQELSLSKCYTSPDTIPFTLTEFNNISISAVFNKKDSLDLMFHTAAGAVFLTKEGMKKTESIAIDDTATINTWGGQASARYSSTNTLQIGELIWDDIEITEDMHSGKLTDGKFGAYLFEDYIIEFDFDHEVLVLHTYLPSKVEEFEQLELVNRSGHWYIQATLNVGEKNLPHYYLIHSGYSGGLLLDDEFSNKHKIGDQLETVSENELKDSFGNIIKTKKVLVPKLQIGEIAFSKVPVGLFEGTLGRQKISVLGADLLKRFNLIIDVQEERIYLKPNSNFDIAFN